MIPASCVRSISSAAAIVAAVTSSVPKAAGGFAGADGARVAAAEGAAALSEAPAGLHALTMVPAKAVTAPLRKNARLDSVRDIIELIVFPTPVPTESVLSDWLLTVCAPTRLFGLLQPRSRSALVQSGEGGK